MKKAVALLSLLVMVMAVVTACSGSNANSGSNAGSGPGSASNPGSAASSGSAPSAEPKAVTLKFWTTEKSAYVEELEAFTKAYPHIKVESVYMGNYDAMTQKVMAAIVSNDLPHVVQLGQRHGIPQMADSGKLLPIENFLSKEDIDDIYQGFWDRYEYKGVKWTIPFESSNPILYYNKTLFDEAGLQVPETWDDVVAAGKALTKDGVWGVNWGGDSPWYYQPMVWNRGGQLIGQDGKLYINGKESVETLKSLQDLVHVHKIMPPNQMASAAEDFAAGKLAMYFRSGSFLTSMEKNVGDKFEFGLAFLPKITERWVPIGGNALGIFKSDADHEAASWQLVQYLTSKEYTVQGSIKTGYIPIRRSAHELQDFQDHLQSDPKFKVTIDQMEYLRGQTIHPADALIWSEIVTAIETVHADAKADPQAILDGIQAEVESYMKDY